MLTPPTWSGWGSSSGTRTSTATASATARFPAPSNALAAYFTRGTGHNDKSGYSERPEDWKKNLDRMARKHETARQALPAPVIEGDPHTKVGLIAYGGTHWAVVEARDQLREEGIATSYCRIRALPVSDEVKHFIERHLRVYVVEQNRDAQVTSLLKSNSERRAGGPADSDHALQRHSDRRAEHRPADPELGEEPVGAGLADRRRRAGQPAGAPRGDRVGRVAGAAARNRVALNINTRLLTYTISERRTEAIQSWPAKLSFRSRATASPSRCRRWPFRGCPRRSARDAATTASRAT